MKCSGFKCKYNPTATFIKEKLFSRLVGEEFRVDTYSDCPLFDNGMCLSDEKNIVQIKRMRQKVRDYWNWWSRPLAFFDCEGLEETVKTYFPDAEITSFLWKGRSGGDRKMLEIKSRSFGRWHHLTKGDKQPNGKILKQLLETQKGRIK